MPTQHEKFAAHAEHLLDGYLGLREKWEMLAPVQSRVPTGVRVSVIAGFRVLRRTLLFATILDAANLCSDRFETTPSLLNVAKALSVDAFRKQARKAYAELAQLPPPDKAATPALAAALKRSSRERVSARGDEFDGKYAEFSSLWQQLQESEELRRVKNARDRVVAHNEVHFVTAQYAPVDLDALGLTFTDLSTVVTRMQTPIDLSQHLLRSAGFDWSSAEPHYEAARQFWEAR